MKMVETDFRVKLMNEVLNGIRIIKYYAWENAFVSKIKDIRSIEVGYLRKMGFIFNLFFGLLLLGQLIGTCIWNKLTYLLLLLSCYY